MPKKVGQRCDYTSFGNGVHAPAGGVGSQQGSKVLAEVGPNMWVHLEAQGSKSFPPGTMKSRAPVDSFTFGNWQVESEGQVLGNNKTGNGMNCVQ